MDNKKPKNSKANKKRKAVPIPKDQLSEDPLSLPEQANLQQLFAQCLNRYQSEELVEKKLKHKEMNQLASIMEEYLNCFIVVGFSLQDEKVCIFNASTSKDEAALVDFLRATFFEISNNRP